eukprot:m.91203 g.91203  ORF g.91203 m.91203 type:complete len:576 (-) comp12941_c0_seq1:2727-4454(-)
MHWKMAETVQEQEYKCIATFNGHAEAVTSVAFSPDGQLAVSGSSDTSLKLWSLRQQECVANLNGHTNHVIAVAFSPDGQHVVSGSGDASLKLWSVQQQECVATLNGHTDLVRSVAFSPNGQYIVSSSYDKTLRLWNIQKQECVATLNGHTDYVNAVVFSPDGEHVLSGSGDKTLMLWNIHKQACVATLEGHTSVVKSIAFSPDGQLVVSGSNDKSLMLWSVQQQSCVTTLNGHTDCVNWVAFLPDGQYTISGSNDKTLKLWSVSQQECIATLTGHTDTIRSIAVSPDGQHVVSGSNDKSLKVWSKVSQRSTEVLFSKQLNTPSSLGPPSNWSCQEVLAWMESKSAFRQYKPQFLNLQMDGQDLLSLTTQDLEQMGMNGVHATSFVNTLARMESSVLQTAAMLTSLNQSEQLTLHEVLTQITATNSHVKSLSDELDHVKSQSKQLSQQVTEHVTQQVLQMSRDVEQKLALLSLEIRGVSDKISRSTMPRFEPAPDTQQPMHEEEDEDGLPAVAFSRATVVRQQEPPDAYDVSSKPKSTAGTRTSTKEGVPAGRKTIFGTIGKKWSRSLLATAKPNS